MSLLTSRTATGRPLASRCRAQWLATTRRVPVLVAGLAGPEGLAGQLDRRQRRLQREALAPGADPFRLPVARPRGAGADAGVPRPVGQEGADRLADGLVGGAAEGLLGGGVEQPDVLALVDHQDRVHGGVDDGRELGARLGQATLVAAAGQ